MGPRWPGHYFWEFEKLLPQPEIKSTRRIHLEIGFNPTWCFIRSSIFYWKSLLSKLLLILLHYFIIFGLKQYSKKHEQKRWETRRRRAEESAFVYQNNKRNESVTLANK